MTSRSTPVSAANDPGPADEWAALAPRLAARGRARISRDGGRNYRARDERHVTETLPNQPAAVLVYDATGCAPVICLDLDSSRGDVERDLTALTGLLDRCGASWFSDVSPNGGRHIYVPLAQAAPFAEARALVLALAARTPTLDPLPMLNIAAGCIRPPGARHRTGGHQRLSGSITRAVEAFRHPASASAWRRLLDETGTVVEAPALVPVPRVKVEDATGEPQLEALSGFSEPDGSFVTIARTGDWPAEKYRSASEARQAVVWSAVASGWALADVARRLGDGTWPGLASMYARYSSKHRHTALVRDWRRAVAFETERRKRSGSDAEVKPVRIRTTSPHQTQAGAVNREVRVWLAAVDMLTRTADPAVRAVLYALGEAAALTGSLAVEHGNRSLAIATGLNQSSVGRALKALREAPRDRLLIDLVRPAEGVRAATYTLVVPDLLRPAAERKPWRRGRIHAVRPAFRELGLVAAFVYAALEQTDVAVGGRDLAALAGFGHTATYDALLVLASWGLVEKRDGGWVLGQADLKQLAEQFGVDEQVAEQIAKYRAERLAWWRYLGIVDQGPAAVDPQVTRLSDWRARPPDDDVGSLLGLLEDVLGARVIG